MTNVKVKHLPMQNIHYVSRIYELTYFINGHLYMLSICLQFEPSLFNYEKDLAYVECDVYLKIFRPELQ